MRKYMKSIVALVGNLAASVIMVTGPDSSVNKIAAGVIALLTVLGVYQVKNKTS